MEYVEIYRHKYFGTVHYKGVYIFWWDQELNLAKDKSMKSYIAWKSAGMPYTQWFHISMNINQINLHINNVIVMAKNMKYHQLP